MSRLPTVAGIVVTYFPDAGFDHRLAAIAREVKPLIVIDNSADKDVQSRVRAMCVSQGAQLIANTKNCGLAAALNQGFKLLSAHGITSVIAFDQDSTPADGFAAALTTTASHELSRVVIGANWRDEARPTVWSGHLRRHPHLPFFFQRPLAEQDLANVTCAITSGTLFDLTTWRALGGFDETLFLDLVDTDYCLRARAAGHTLAISAGAQLIHRRGAKEPVRLLGHTWWPAFMPPLRLRYLFRNRIRLIARHGYQTPHWVAFEIIYTIKIIAEILFLEDKKSAKLIACLLGTWDGLLGRRGRIPPT